MPVNHSLTSAQIAIYRQTSQKRWRKSEPLRKKRRQKAWQLAQQAATILKDKFGATKVMVFGSLVDEERFTLWSDVDIAAWGISPQDTFTAMGTLWDLDEEIEVNLVDVGVCRSHILKAILEEGINL